MKVADLLPSVTSRKLFHWRDLKFIPEISGCYVIATYTQDILYIGLSHNLKLRMQQHLENPNKTNATEIGLAYYFYFLTVAPRMLEKVERGWLNAFELEEGKLPILNSVHSPLR